MSVHQILCLTIKILRNEDFAKSRGGVAFAESRSDRKISGNEDFANCAASGTAGYTLTPRRVRSIKTRQKGRQTFFGKNSLQHTWKVLQCKQMIQKGTTKMLNRTFAAVYFYFYFTFFRGKVNFAAMS